MTLYIYQYAENSTEPKSTDWLVWEVNGKDNADCLANLESANIMDDHNYATFQAW